MFQDKTTPALRIEYYRLIQEIDAVETGEVLCIPRIYIKMLTRLHLLDIEITRRSRTEESRTYEK